MTKLKVISPIKDLTDIGPEVQKVVEQQFDLKQQILGAGKNQAQVNMTTVVVAQSEEVKELLKALLFEQDAAGNKEEPVEYLMAKLLNRLPAPRWKNLQLLSRLVADKICDGNHTHAAKYLGVSLRTIKNHRDAANRVKEIEDGA